MHCTESNRGRHVHRSFFADYLDRVKAYQQTFAYQKALNKRKVWVEPLFGEGKQWHGMRRFRLRRLWRVNCEALVIATGQNLKRLLQKRGWGRRPFPAEAVATVPPPHHQGEESLRNGRGTIHSRKVSVAGMAAFSLQQEGGAPLRVGFLWSSSLFSFFHFLFLDTSLSLFTVFTRFIFFKVLLWFFSSYILVNSARSFSTGWTVCWTNLPTLSGALFLL